LLEDQKKEIKGEYVINPEMFWKGSLKDRAELRVKFEAVYKDETS
jgi:hypothetical protein